MTTIVDTPFLYPLIAIEKGHRTPSSKMVVGSHPVSYRHEIADRYASWTCDRTGRLVSLTMTTDGHYLEQLVDDLGPVVAERAGQSFLEDSSPLKREIWTRPITGNGTISFTAHPKEEDLELKSIVRSGRDQEVAKLVARADLLSIRNGTMHVRRRSPTLDVTLAAGKLSYGRPTARSIAEPEAMLAPNQILMPLGDASVLASLGAEDLARAHIEVHAFAPACRLEAFASNVAGHRRRIEHGSIGVVSAFEQGDATAGEVLAAFSRSEQPALSLLSTIFTRILDPDARLPRPDGSIAVEDLDAVLAFGV